MKLEDVTLLESPVLIGNRLNQKLYAVGKKKKEDFLVVTISIENINRVDESNTLATFDEVLKFSQPDDWTFTDKLDALIGV